MKRSDWPQLMHGHPIMIFFYFGKYFYLLLIPLARGFWGAVQNDFYGWLSSVWIDILVLLVMAFLAFLNYYNKRFAMEERGLFVQMGVFSRKEMFIPFARITTITVIEDFYLRPIGVSHFRIDTMAQDRSRFDFDILVSTKKAEPLFSVCPPKPCLIKECRPRGVYIAVLSALLSNSFAGIVFLAVFINQAGRILGQQFQQRLMETFTEFTHKMAFGLPPVAAAIGYVLIGGWVIMFLKNLLRYKSFVSRCAQDNIIITGGFFTRRSYRIFTSSLNFLSVRQSLLTRVLRLYSVSANSAGFGKQKEDMSIVIPSVGHKGLVMSLELLFPSYKMVHRSVKPRMNAVMQYLLDPLWLFLLFWIGANVVAFFLPEWAQIIFYVRLMGNVIATWLALVRITDFFTAGIGYDKQSDTFTIRYSRRFLLNAVLVKRQNIARVQLRQSIFQKATGLCDVLIYTTGEKSEIHHVKGVKWQEIEDFWQNTPL